MGLTEKQPGLVGNGKSPLALWKSWGGESASGLAHSKTLRRYERFIGRAGVREGDPSSLRPTQLPVNARDVTHVIVGSVSFGGQGDVFAGLPVIAEDFEIQAEIQVRVE